MWYDALANYLSGLGYASPPGADYRRWWVEGDRRLHVIGKGILRFHAVYWPAILLSAGVPVPTDIVVHDYLTVDGRKLGKSLGNDDRPGRAGRPVRHRRPPMVAGAGRVALGRRRLHRRAAGRAGQCRPGQRLREPGQPGVDPRPPPAGRRRARHRRRADRGAGAPAARRLLPAAGDRRRGDRPLRPAPGERRRLGRRGRGQPLRGDGPAVDAHGRPARHLAGPPRPRRPGGGRRAPAVRARSRRSAPRPVRRSGRHARCPRPRRCTARRTISPQ